MILFWFALTVIFILFLQGQLFKRYVMRKLQYERRFKTSACFKDDEIELVEQISNEKWLPVPWLRVESLLESSLQFRRGDNFAVSSGQLLQNHHSFFTLSSYMRITRTHKLKPTRRGWYKLNSVTLTGGDLLALHRMSVKHNLDSELIVYPKPAEVSIAELASHSWQGDQSVRRFIVHDPFVIAGAREYQPGDSYKQVNWKATARTGALQVHQYDYTADRRLMIYLNVDDGEGMWRSVSNEELIEKGIELAAGAAEVAVVQGMEAGFGANMPLIDNPDSAFLEPAAGREHLLAMFELMAKLRIERTVKFSQLLEQVVQNGIFGHDILIISSYWNDELEQLAGRLRSNGNSVSMWKLSGGEGTGA